jgi:hypothetical protein
MKLFIKITIGVLAMWQFLTLLDKYCPCTGELCNSNTEYSDNYY